MKAMKVQLPYLVLIIWLYSTLIVDLCAAELCIIDEFESDEVGWIACDVCKCWYHKYCCNLGEKENPRRFRCEKHR